MTISEIIAELEKARNSYGDIDCLIVQETTEGREATFPVDITVRISIDEVEGNVVIFS